MKVRILFFVILCGFAICYSQNINLGLKSAVLPGMAQLSTGGGELSNKNTIKGLAIMSGFTVCLHNMIGSISGEESYAEQTSYYKRMKSEATDYEKQVEYTQKWNEAYDNWEDTKTMKNVFIGLTASIYVYGIIDAMLFTKNKIKTSGIIPKEKKTEFVSYIDQCGVSKVKVLCRF